MNTAVYYTTLHDCLIIVQQELAIIITRVEPYRAAAVYARLNMKEAAIKHLTFAIENNYSIAEISSTTSITDISATALIISSLVRAMTQIPRIF